MTDRLLCRHCGTAVRVAAARFVGPAVLCAACHGELALCPERGCGGRLLEILAGPEAGNQQCPECGRICGPGEIPGRNVIQFPEPGVQSGA